MNNRYEAVSNSIQEFSELFLSNPLNFLNEYEVQCEYMAILKSNLDEHFEYYNPFNKEKGKFSAVRREYQIYNAAIRERTNMNKVNQYKIDTVLLKSFNNDIDIKDEDDWNNIFTSSNHDYFYNLDIDYGIEFKTCLFGNIIDYFIKGTLKDAEKLQFLLDYHFINTGIAFCCFNKYSVNTIKEYIANHAIDESYNYVYPDDLTIKENCINIVFIAGNYDASPNIIKRTNYISAPINNTGAGNQIVSTYETAFGNKIQTETNIYGNTISNITIIDYKNLISKYNLRGKYYTLELNKTKTDEITAKMYLEIEKILKENGFIMSTPLDMRYNNWGFSKVLKSTDEKLYGEFFPSVFWINFVAGSMRIEISERFLNNIKNKLEEVGVSVNNEANYKFFKGQGSYYIIQGKELENYREILEILMPLFRNN